MAVTGDHHPGTSGSDAAARRFYDQLAPDYHLIYPDWGASIRRQARSLDALIGQRCGPGSRAILDCACGIGTQAIGLAARGHVVTGTDLSVTAVTRAGMEAATRSVRLPVAAADMRALPFQAGVFDVVLCADNSLPHLLTPDQVSASR